MLRGALAGAAAAGAWAAQQPLDMRAFGVDYSDPELLGSAVTRERGTLATEVAGHLLHLGNGAVFGAAYALAAPALPGSGAARGVTAGVAEHLATWPLTGIAMQVHPVGESFPRLWGNHRAFAQGLWRHVLFGALLGELERRLNRSAGAAPGDDGDRRADPQTNGHGPVEHLVVTRSA